MSDVIKKLEALKRLERESLERLTEIKFPFNAAGSLVVRNLQDSLLLGKLLVIDRSKYPITYEIHEQHRQK
jgi:hypothetical protein